MCAAGKASSRLLANRYQRGFSRYIDRICLCDPAELARFDFDKADYILTTVNVAVYVPKPIMEVGYFFSDNDRAAVQELLEKGESSFLRKYFRPSAFYTDITGDTKEEIIQQMCERAGYDTELPEGFADAVLKREALAPTEFGTDTLDSLHKLPSIMWSQEYQDEYYERNFSVFDSYDFITGELTWNFADFQTTEGIMRVNGNKKGVFTRNRQPKSSAFVLKKRWDNK